ncbi:hypothetical protein ACFCX4_10440 [Kitasatospora sp. NPDC056327]|uniref:VMAP-C domain-containing protein n=1 Tax=Kitasatospora sp. NPDC056327 TaxID=3345785 RepID=UPI0035E2A121
MSGPAAAPRPRAREADQLLTDVLLGCLGRRGLAFRLALLDAMEQSPGMGGFAATVTEHGEARTHVRNLVDAIANREDPVAALEALGAALPLLIPHDRALAWLDLTVQLTTHDPEAFVDELFPVAAELHRLPALSGLHRHVPANTSGLRNLTGQESLPQLLGRLVDRRDPDVIGPLTAFLESLGEDEQATRCAALPRLKAFVARFGKPGPAKTAPAADRLILQIRLEEETPEHAPEAQYRLRLAYYHQPLAGGRFQRVQGLPATESVSESKLLTVGSETLARWTELTRDIRGKAVRVEFLLPRPMLGHPAEWWCPGSTGRPLGHLHPVVVRSLERYTDPFLNQGFWQERWDGLGDPAAGPDPADVLSGIGWPPLDPTDTAKLADWFNDRPALACLGLDVPYDQLHTDVQHAVNDAMYVDGLPALIWRRVAGGSGTLLDALRKHPPARLTDLPDTVHRYRVKLRGRGPDPQHDVTLLYEDPNCVDPDQDSPFPGMMG